MVPHSKKDDNERKRTVTAAWVVRKPIAEEPV